MQLGQLYIIVVDDMEMGPKAEPFERADIADEMARQWIKGTRRVARRYVWNVVDGMTLISCYRFVLNSHVAERSDAAFEEKQSYLFRDRECVQAMIEAIVDHGRENVVCTTVAVTPAGNLK